MTAGLGSRVGANRPHAGDVVGDERVVGFEFEIRSAEEYVKG
jgi:hypothetical protein